jgi:hypoxanthine phosphoribosyltransferase
MALTIQRTLLRREEIGARVAHIGAQITADLERERQDLERQGADPGPVVLVPVLTGALVFVADLIRAMPISLSIRPVTLSSYPGASTTSQGVTVQGGVPTDLRGARVLIVDDILDSGRTLALLRRLVEAQKPRSVRLAVLLNKRKVRSDEVGVEYVCFEIEDEFVVGYGLDYDGLYRNLPEVCTLG